jgi:hypothetical protein
VITIKDMSTPELLAALRDVKVMPNDWDSDAKRPVPRKVFVGSRKVPGGTAEYPLYESVHALVGEIEAELATRPHVPGKVEGKLLRRLMAQTGWTEEALRAHPRYGEQLADAQHPNRRKISRTEAKRLVPVIGRRHIGNNFKIVEFK